MEPSKNSTADNAYLYKKTTMWLHKLLSYLFPIPYKVLSSDWTQKIELTYLNGKLVVDSKYANYSYGSLQKILRKALLNIGIDNIRNMKQILILGVGGGSVIKTLRDELKTTAKITAIEVDEKMLYIAKRYFDLHRLADVELIHQDAEKYVLQTNNSYDLILIDLFIETDMPDFVYSDLFIQNIQKMLHNNGYIIFNTMEKNSDISKKNTSFEKKFSSSVYPVLKKISMDIQNQVYIIKKIS